MRGAEPGASLRLDDLGTAKPDLRAGRRYDGGVNERPPGWHMDPESSRRIRYWDGEKWVGRPKSKYPPAERGERLMSSGRKLEEVGDAISEFGKGLFWFGLCLLFIVFVSIPILSHLF